MTACRCRLVDYEPSLCGPNQPKPGDMWYGEEIPTNPDAGRRYLGYREMLKEHKKGPLPRSSSARAREAEYRQRMSLANDHMERLVRLSEADAGKRPLMICLPGGEEYELGLVGQDGKAYRRALSVDVVDELTARLLGREPIPLWTGTPPIITLLEKFSTPESGEWWIRKGTLSDDVIGGVFEDLFQNPEN